MPSARDELYALAKKKRSAKNLEAIQEMLSGLRSHADDAEETIGAVARLREALEEIGEGNDENPFTPWFSEILLKAQDFLTELPSEEADSIDDLITEAEGYAEEYEQCLDDRDYSADNREEVWGNLCDALEEIAKVMS
jgi:hypothetical protein